MKASVIKRSELSPEAYRNIDAVNFSSLKSMARSPLHYMHARRSPKEQTAGMLLGSAIHTACLEPERFLLDYAVFDGERRQGKKWDEFEAANAHRIILKSDQYAVAWAAQKAVRRNKLASTLLADGDVESTLIWKDAETGVRCKGRPDHIGWPATLVDVKTTTDASHFAFSRRSHQMLHHVQLAFYADGYAAVTGQEARVMVIAVEQSAPHDVVVYTVDEDVLAVGRDMYRSWLIKLVECTESGVWPGYCADGSMPLQLPAYAMPQEDSELESLGLEM